MSLVRFHRETGEALRRGDASTIEQAQALVRDRWLGSGEYRAIVAAVLGNWTSGNCIPFMAPVSSALLGANEPELHRVLWARSIKRQADTFFREYGALRGQKLTVDQILSVDASGFDEFDWNAYADKRAAASFLLRRLLSDLDRWRDELEAHGLDSAQVAGIAASLAALRRPRIDVGTLPADDAAKPAPLRA